MRVIMVGIRCSGEETLKLHEMCPLQGNLKKRSRRQLNELKASLLSEGLIAPFFIWEGTLSLEEGRKKWLLDGHARREALEELSKEDPSIMWDEDFPVVYIEAAGLDEAKKALLQITSQYGKVDKAGAREFCASIKGYRAPAVSAIYRKPYVRKQAAPVPQSHAAPLPEAAGAKENEVMMTIAVPRSYEKAVRDLFNSVSYIRVL